MATLPEFLADDDPNKWWRLQSGDMQNLFDDAVECLEEVNSLLEQTEAAAWKYVAIAGQRDDVSLWDFSRARDQLEVALAAVKKYRESL